MCTCGSHGIKRRIVAVCDLCEEPIYEGEEYLNSTKIICKFCLEDMSALELAEEIGEKLETATPDYPEEVA